MTLLNELSDSLKKYLSLGKPRRECLVNLVLALLSLKSVSLCQLALAMPGEAILESKYRQLQRFFAHCRLDYNQIAKVIMTKLWLGSKKYDIVLDRTNWKWGKTHLNILFLCVAYEGFSVPVFWLVLNHGGNSSQRERIALVKRFVTVFGSEQIMCVLADREFIGQKWWAWLTEQGLSFRIRVKKNQEVSYKEKVTSVGAIFENLARGKRRILRRTRLLSGQQIWLSASRMSDGKLMIVASNLNEMPSDAIFQYLKRWSIETMFQCLKSQGFDFEKTRLLKRARIKRLIVILALSYAWSITCGQYKHRCVNPIKIKKHGRPAQSLFRYGLDYLTETLRIIHLNTKRLCKVFLFFWVDVDLVKDAAQIVHLKTAT